MCTRYETRTRIFRNSHSIFCSGDGTLSVLDVRSKKTEPFAHSEDQEDELLSIVAIKGYVSYVYCRANLFTNEPVSLFYFSGQKLIVGTQLGILTVFNRKSGYGDCVDRIPGHPHSIDALSPIPSRYPNSASTILTGSSDGLVRVVEVLPSKLVGVVADHGNFPVERVRVDREGEGNWVASVGHEEVLKLTDLREVFEDGNGDESEAEEKDESEDSDAGAGEDESENEEVEEPKSQLSPALTKPVDEKNALDGSDASEDEGSSEGEGDDDPREEKTHGSLEVHGTNGSDDEAGAESGSEEGVADQPSVEDSDAIAEHSKRKRKKDIDPFKASKKPKGRNEIEADSSFFADL